MPDNHALPTRTLTTDSWWSISSTVGRPSWAFDKRCLRGEIQYQTNPNFLSRIGIIIALKSCSTTIDASFCLHNSLAKSGVMDIWRFFSLPNVLYAQINNIKVIDKNFWKQGTQEFYSRKVNTLFLMIILPTRKIRWAETRQWDRFVSTTMHSWLPHTITKTYIWYRTRSTILSIEKTTSQVLLHHHPFKKKKTWCHKREPSTKHRLLMNTPSSLLWIWHMNE